MMMSWLKTASPTKRKNPDEDTSAKAPEEKPAAEKQTKPAGPLQQWLLGSGSSKKPRTWKQNHNVLQNDQKIENAPWHA